MKRLLIAVFLPVSAVACGGASGSGASRTTAPTQGGNNTATGNKNTPSVNPSTVDDRAKRLAVEMLKRREEIRKSKSIVVKLKCPPGTVQRESRIHPGVLAWCLDKVGVHLSWRLQLRHRHGPSVRLDSNGQIRQRARYRRGRLHGPVEFWYANGQRKSRSWMVRAAGKQASREWYDNGQQKHRSTMLNGQRHGLAREWHRNGQLASRLHFDRGALKRHVEYWDDKGQQIAKIRITTALLLVTHLRRSGKRQSSGHYLAGKKHGEWLHWRPNGRLFMRAAYDSGARHGRTIMWGESGDRVSEQCYRRGYSFMHLTRYRGRPQLRVRRGKRRAASPTDIARFCSNVVEQGPMLGFQPPAPRPQGRQRP